MAKSRALNLEELPECTDTEHQAVTIDRFARDFPGSRKMPGNCYCIKCSTAVPFYWNDGRPKPVPDEEMEAWANG